MMIVKSILRGSSATTRSQIYKISQVDSAVTAGITPKMKKPQLTEELSAAATAAQTLPDRCVSVQWKL